MRPVGGAGIASRNRRFPVADQQVTTYRIGVDGAIQVVAAVVVVGHIERKIVSEIVLYPQVDLLGVAIFEVLRRGKAKGLQQQRESRVEVILIGKHRVRLEGVEALLVGQISKAGIASGEATGVEDPLEKIGGVEIQRAASR